MWDFDPCLSFCKNIVLEGLGDLSYLWGHAWHPVSFHSLTILAGQSHNSKVSHCIPLSNFQCTSDVVLKIILLQTGFSNILLLAEKRGTNVSSRDRSKPFLLFFLSFFCSSIFKKTIPIFFFVSKLDKCIQNFSVHFHKKICTLSNFSFPSRSLSEKYTFLFLSKVEFPFFLPFIFLFSKLVKGYSVISFFSKLENLFFSIGLFSSCQPLVLAQVR